MKSWYDAVNQNSVKDFRRLVANKQVANTYIPASHNQIYTPALYLARISPSNAKQMLSHLLELDADLSLLAKTEDCMIRNHCTTIGNLASWRWQEGLDFKTEIMYHSLVELNEGKYKDPSNPLAEENARRWKKGWQPCVTTGLGGKWKPGCGIPGISYISSAKRAVRNTGIGVAKGTKQAAMIVGYTGLLAGKVAGTVLTSPFFLTAVILDVALRRGGGKIQTRKGMRNNRKTMRRKSF
jgi:hypothetical protein